MNEQLRTLSIAALAGCILTTGSACATSSSGPDMLSYIPDDSPYVFAMTEPFPDALLDKLEPAAEEMMGSYRTIISYAMQEELAKQDSPDADPEQTEKFRGLMDEVLGLLSLDGMREAGIERNALMAFYGHGLLPVMRLELSDEALFDAAIARFEAKAEATMPVAEAAGATYRYFDADTIRVIIATIDGQAVITAAPVSFDEAEIAKMLGVTKPSANLGRSKRLAKLNDEFGFQDLATGYVDVTRITETFIGDRSGVDAALFALLDDDEDADEPALSAECKAEIMELAEVAPRIVFGYTNVGEDHMDSAMIWELRDDIAEGLATLTAPVPGLGVDPGGLFSFGMSIDPQALMSFVEARLDAIEADPFECEGLSSIQNLVPSGRAMLAQPIPPVAYAFRGFVANITDVEGMDISSDTPPSAVDGAVTLAIENAESLVMMAAMFDPQVAALNLLPDGKPIKVETDQINAMTDEAYAAMSQNALAISVGNGAERAAATALTAATTEPSPFMSMAMDSQRYYDMIGEAMLANESDDDGNEIPVEVRLAIGDLMTASGKLYDRVALDVRFTEQGVKLDGRVTLGE